MQQSKAVVLTILHLNFGTLGIKDENNCKLVYVGLRLWLHPTYDITELRRQCQLVEYQRPNLRQREDDLRLE